jgi:CheY-like chemotaxis protein
VNKLDAKRVQTMAPFLERVLVVDPSAQAARLLIELLRDIWPGQAWTAATTERALALAEQVDPGLILVEHSGESLDGLVFTRKLRRGVLRCRKAPVVMITATATAASILGARDVGVHEFLRKPFTNADLVRRVEAVTLHPRPWIEGTGYVGPDRRRFNSANYTGKRKRRTDPLNTAGPEQERISQAIRIVVSAAKSAESEPFQATRALNVQASELAEAAAAIQDSALAHAAQALQRYLASVTAGARLTREGVQAHADRLSTFLPKDAKDAARSAA